MLWGLRFNLSLNAELERRGTRVAMQQSLMRAPCRKAPQHWFAAISLRWQAICLPRLADAASKP
jgi:hypothetical protein